MSVADYCAELELATPLTGRVTNSGGTPSVRDTGAWYARCYDPDEANAWVRVDDTTLTFADIYLSSESPTTMIQIVPGFSYDIEVWALSETNTVTYGGKSSTNGSLVITLNTPNHVTSKDLKKVYDDLEFTLGDNLVASDVWVMQSGRPEEGIQFTYYDPLQIASYSGCFARLAPHAYDSTSFVTLTFVAGEDVSLKPMFGFATMAIPVTCEPAWSIISNLHMAWLYKAHTKPSRDVGLYVGERSVYDLSVSEVPVTEDTQVDVVVPEQVDITVNIGDVTSVANWGEDITDQLPKVFTTDVGMPLSAFISLRGISTTPTATGWKDMSDDTVILDTDVLVDGQSIYPYI